MNMANAPFREREIYMLTIRPACHYDADAIWRIFHAVVSTGDTYAYDPDTSRDEALSIWMGPKGFTYVAEEDERIVGTYLLKANQPGLGAHVANAGFMVDPETQARGIGRAMGEHCLAEARRLDFRAMQFNLVVSTNEHAVALWQKLGFEIVGRLPSAFHHRQLGYVDAYVMYRSLLGDKDILDARAEDNSREVTRVRSQKVNNQFPDAEL
jgi:ribosomal protein S18 acetylase RimI-like enzyme